MRNSRQLRRNTVLRPVSPVTILGSEPDSGAPETLVKHIRLGTVFVVTRSLARATWLVARLMEAFPPTVIWCPDCLAAFYMPV